MKKISLLSLALLTGVVGVLFLMPKENSRSDYQTFLKSKYQDIPAPKTGGKEDKTPDEPQMAAFRDYFMMLDPAEKRVPFERLKTARYQTQSIQTTKSNSEETLNWNRIESDMGGRTRGLMWDPNDPETSKVWAGSVTGGLWYNNDITNEFSEWNSVSDLWPNLTVSSIVYDPNNTETFYVGTGEAPTAIYTYRESSGVGVGIWKTTDGGDTWELLSSTEDFKYITDLAVRNEAGASVVYAGVVSGEYKGVPHVSAPTDGLYRSEDGGASWEQVLPNIDGLDVPYAPSDIEITADNRIFVGTGRNLNGEGAARIFHSDDGTAGSWTMFDDYIEIIENDDDHQLPGRVMIASAPSDANRKYALISSGYISSGNNRSYYHVEYILRSDNNGESWTEVNNNNAYDYWASLAWHALTIAVDPNNPDHLYIGGLDQHHSLDGGNSWIHVSDWAGMYYGGGSDYIHADQHSIKFKPGSSDEVIFATDGGIFYTQTSTQNNPVFYERNNNYSCLQFYTCDINPNADQAQYLGGLQDNGSLFYNGTDLDINDMVMGGDGAFCFWGKNESQYFVTSYYYNRYRIFQNGNFLADLGQECGTFLCPADFDWNQNTLYANAVGWTGDNADKILRIADVIDSPNTGDLVSVNTGAQVPFSAVTFNPYSASTNNNLYLGTEAGQLFKVEDADAVPSALEIGSSDFPTAFLSCITFGESEDEILVTFSNYGVSSVWYTSNGGSDWIEKESNLPDMPIRWAIFHPVNKKQVMLATELGVWTTNDITAENVLWSPDNNGLSNVRVDMLKVRESDNMVLAAGHGRGLHTVVWDDNTYTESPEMMEMVMYPNPATDYFNINLDNAEGKFSTLHIFDISGRNVLEHSLNSDEINERINIERLESGTYIVQLAGIKQSQSYKLVVK